ncbi:MAG: hypothetical protein KGN76_00420 [Acidobacteriota bacterium]|nr:hypothetical protein [Acidobacteriota bacterium]
MTADRPRLRDLAGLALLTLAAFLVHGYHPGVEDAEIYLPGILKRLYPALYPRNTVFFESHAHMTLFPELMAGSVRLLHLPVAEVMLLWQLASIFLLLLAVWRIARLCFTAGPAAWGAVALVGSLLTLPIAGTDLYLLDQYVTPRSLSTPIGLLAAGEALAGRPWRAVALIVLIAPIHPLMAVFAGALVAVLIALERWPLGGRAREAAAGAGLLALPSLFPPVTDAYRRILDTRPAFLLTRWAWYEWLGILGPFVILAGFARLARRQRRPALARLCRALLVFEGAFFALALVVSMPGPFERFAEIQPMRSLQLVYALMFLVVGGLAGEYLLHERTWRPVAFLVPIAVLCGGMWYAQLQLFPASRHVELPWMPPQNHWVRAFEWIRDHTPVDAYFALNPRYLALPGEDEHGFRAIARRSRIADALKDSGVASMFPQVSEEWAEQVDALKGWDHFTRDDFLRLRRQYGIDWIVTRRPVDGLACPYETGGVWVCQVVGGGA